MHPAPERLAAASQAAPRDLRGAPPEREQAPQALERLAAAELVRSITTLLDWGPNPARYKTGSSLLAGSLAHTRRLLN